MCSHPAPFAVVTGAGGFIGSHLTEELVRRGWRVRGLHRDNAREEVGALGWVEREVLREVEIVFGDLRDVESVLSALSGAEVVFHLGAQIAIPYSYLNPRTFFETNVIGSLNVARAAQDCAVQRLIHVSTSEVYGTAQLLPIAETHPLQPQSPYAASKVGADALMNSFHLTYGLPVSIVRPFNTYGPRQSARAVIPTIIGQALASDKLRLGSLHPERDFTYVSDTVSALIGAALEPATIGRTVHIGSGQSHSVTGLVEQVGQLLNRELQVETDERRVRPPDSEVQQLLCDPSLARDLIGFSPAVTLGEGLSRTLSWIEATSPAGKIRQSAA